MEALYREFRVALPWELLYADDLAVIAETEDDLNKRLNEWKDFVQNRGMRVNMNKTKVVISGEWQKVMQKVVTLCYDLKNAFCAFLARVKTYTHAKNSTCIFSGSHLRAVTDTDDNAGHHSTTTRVTYRQSISPGMHKNTPNYSDC